MMLFKYLMRIYLLLRYLSHKVSRTGTFSPRHSSHYLTEPYKNAGNPIKYGLHRRPLEGMHGCQWL